MRKDLRYELQRYGSSDILPMHMPGHKRNPDLVDDAFLTDITEIDGFDDLHDPHGLILDIEDKAARLYGAKKAFICVNGSTALIGSAVCACTSRGESFLFSGNSHISVWHAAELTDLVPVVSPLAESQAVPFPVGTDTAEFIKILKENPDIRTALITTPTYEGEITDTSEIRMILNARGGILIADCAHGAHLGLHPYFPERPDADIVIMSTHKTLQSPTQTAVMGIYTDKADCDRIRHFLGIFQSSSPSYVLMGGLCRTINDLLSSPGIFTPWTEGLKDARERLKGLHKLSLRDDKCSDPSKLTILTNGYINGTALADELRRSYNIETEASFATHLIAMTGIGDTPASLRRFADAVLDIDSNLTDKKTETGSCSLPASQSVTRSTISQALLSGAEIVPLEDSEGRIAAEYIFPYPPGVPVVIPGQVITKDVISYLTTALSDGTHLRIDPARDIGADIKVIR